MTEPHFGGTYQQMLAAAQLAERQGLTSFARCDHYLSDRDPTPDATDAFAILAGLARDTTTIRLCVLVTPITFRHPAVIAKNAATIDQMSGGRFDLGVGTGWMDYEHQAFGLPFPDSAERWARFEEALDYLAAAFGPGRSRYQGRFYRLDAEVKPKPTDIRIVIGGSGKSRTPRLAGSRADEYNFFVCPPRRPGRKSPPCVKPPGIAMSKPQSWARWWWDAPKPSTAGGSSTSPSASGTGELPTSSRSAGRSQGCSSARPNRPQRQSPLLNRRASTGSTCNGSTWRTSTV